MQLLMIVLVSLLAVLALMGNGLVSPSNYDTSAVVDSLAPESLFYDNQAGMNAATAARMKNYKLVNIEQSLVEICRSTYFMAKTNNCSAINTSLTWAFLLNNGNNGSLNSILNAPSSNSFSCAGAAAYGTHLLKSVHSDLTGYNYNLNNLPTHSVQTEGGSTDPCAYADIVINN